MGIVCSSEGREKKDRVKKNSYAAMNRAVELSGGYATQEGKCELIGFRYCEKIDHKEISLEKAIQDIVEYTRWHNMEPKQVQYCWLSLHLALGMCFQYKVARKATVRDLLLELLPYSRGIDMGLFMRDLLYYEDLTTDNIQIEKTLYCMSFCPGFRINLEENGIGDKIFKGPARVVYKDIIRAGNCDYLDIPIGHPTLLMTESTAADNHVGSQCLSLACENLKPKAVQVLLRHGASPYVAIEELLNLLGAAQTVGRARTEPMVMEAPLEIVQECMELCLRVVKQISLCFDGQTFANLKDKMAGVYYVNKGATNYIPAHFYKSPCPLKQSCRCEIRDILLNCGQLPHGVKQLKSLSEDMIKYVDLMC